MTPSKDESGWKKRWVELPAWMDALVRKAGVQMFPSHQWRWCLQRATRGPDDVWGSELWLASLFLPQTSSLKEGNCIRPSEMVLHARITVDTRGLTQMKSCYVHASCSYMREALWSYGRAAQSSPTDMNGRGFDAVTSCVLAPTS